MIIVDGAVGGGQVLRTALSLSALTKQPCIIKNIRSSRPKPGLEAQHLTAVKAVQEVCQASVNGAHVKSTKVVFSPSKIRGGSFSWDVGTAGSSLLVLQTVLPVLLSADVPSHLVIKGGTDTWHALPSFDAQFVFLEVLKRMNVEVDLSVDRFGFFPKGQGQITVDCIPAKKFSALVLNEKGLPERLQISAVVSEDLERKNVADRMINSFLDHIHWKGEKHVERKYVATASPGGFLHSHAHFTNTVLGMTVLAEKKKSAELIGEECAVRFNEELLSDATLDSHTADQLMLYFALAGKGFCKVREITDHMRSNALVIEQFLPIKFSFNNNIIECKNKK